MTLPTGTRGRLVALALLLIPLILLAHYVLSPLIASLVSRGDDLAETRGEIARYQRLIGQMPALRGAVERLERTRPLAPYLLQGDNRALAAAGLQRNLQQAAQEHGVTILSLRVKNPATDGPLERIAVEARLRAGTRELRDLLYFVETTTPYLFVEGLSINARQTRRRDGHAEVGDQQRRHYPGQPDDPAHRQVDPRRDHHHRLPHRNDPDDGDLQQDRQDVLHRQKVLRRDRQEHRDEDQEEERRDALRKLP